MILRTHVGRVGAAGDLGRAVVAVVSEHGESFLIQAHSICSAHMDWCSLLWRTNSFVISRINGSIWSF